MLQTRKREEETETEEETEEETETETREPKQATFGFSEPTDMFSYVDQLKTCEGFVSNEIPDPTTYQPGSWEKVEVLRQRVLVGQCLWHDDDAAMDRRQTHLTKSQGINLEDLS